jgi:hypothetical protein
MPRTLVAPALALLMALLLVQPAAPLALAGSDVTQGPAIEIPAIPDPVAVTLPAATTAFLALDFTDRICGTRPACVATLPAVQSGLTAARAAHVPVFYSYTAGGSIMPDVAPQGESPFLSFGPDKFYNTDLNDMLQQDGVTDLVITGTFANGAVLYTAFAAARLGYTVVVAEDGISSANDFATYYTEYQLLNGPGTSNPSNTPLAAKVVTLSRLDLITYQ